MDGLSVAFTDQKTYWPRPRPADGEQADTAAQPKVATFARLEARTANEGPKRGGTKQCRLVPVMGPGLVNQCVVTAARDFRPQSQIGSQWCWAASMSMIFDAHGYKVPQAQIVREAWGGIVNLPGFPMQILQQLNRDWTDANGKPFRSSTEHNTFIAGASADEIENDLLANRPIMVGTTNHAMVVVAMAYNETPLGKLIVQVNVADPAIGGFRPFYEIGRLSFLARVTTSPIGVDDDDKDDKGEVAKPPRETGGGAGPTDECNYGQFKNQCRLIVSPLPKREIAVGMHGKWTAPLSSILNSKGYQISQAQLAAALDDASSEITLSDLPKYFNKEFADDTGKRFRLQVKVYGFAASMPLPIERLAKEIAENRPSILLHKDGRAFVATSLLYTPDEEDDGRKRNLAANVVSFLEDIFPASYLSYGDLKEVVNQITVDIIPIKSEPATTRAAEAYDGLNNQLASEPATTKAAESYNVLNNQLIAAQRFGLRIKSRLEDQDYPLKFTIFLNEPLAPQPAPVNQAPPLP